MQREHLTLIDRKGVPDSVRGEEPVFHCVLHLPLGDPQSGCGVSGSGDHVYIFACTKSFVNTVPCVGSAARGGDSVALPPTAYNCGVRLSQRTRVIVALWAVGFIVGTTTHTIDLVTGGLNVYAGFPEPVRWFWISLTVIDPLVVLLILFRSRAAAPAAVLVMLADLAVNWTVFSTVGGLSLFGVLTQSAFGLFVFCTAAHVCREHRG